MTVPSVPIPLESLVLSYTLRRSETSDSGVILICLVLQPLKVVSDDISLDDLSVLDRGGFLPDYTLSYGPESCSEEGENHQADYKFSTHGLSIAKKKSGQGINTQRTDSLERPSLLLNSSYLNLFFGFFPFRHRSPPILTTGKTSSVTFVIFLAIRTQRQTRSHNLVVTASVASMPLSFSHATTHSGDILTDSTTFARSLLVYALSLNPTGNIVDGDEDRG